MGLRERTAIWLARRFGPGTLGQRGERAAAKYLKKLGYKIVARGQRGRRGELDLVAVDGRTVVFVEVKTRTGAHEVARDAFEEHPISIYLTVRKYGPLRRLEDLSTALGTLAGHGERLADERVIPHVIIPIRDSILQSG